MFSHKRNIHFTLINSDTKTLVSCYENEYRNLMVLINEMVYAEDFGECKGIGRCGTCLVQIETENTLSPMERNEESTLKKCMVQNKNVRLSCQVMINESLKNAMVQIIEERMDVR